MTDNENKTSRKVLVKKTTDDASRIMINATYLRPQNGTDFGGTTDLPATHPQLSLHATSALTFPDPSALKLLTMRLTTLDIARRENDQPESEARPVVDPRSAERSRQLAPTPGRRLLPSYTGNCSTYTPTHAPTQASPPPPSSRPPQDPRSPLLFDVPIPPVKKPTTHPATYLPPTVTHQQTTRFGRKNLIRRMPHGHSGRTAWTTNSLVAGTVFVLSKGTSTQSMRILTAR